MQKTFSRVCKIKYTAMMFANTLILNTLILILQLTLNTLINNIIIPRARMGYESIAHEAEDRIGY